MTITKQQEKVIFTSEDRVWMTEVIAEWRSRGLDSLADEMQVELDNIKDEVPEPKYKTFRGKALSPASLKYPARRITATS